MLKSIGNTCIHYPYLGESGHIRLKDSAVGFEPTQPVGPSGTNIDVQDKSLKNNGKRYRLGHGSKRKLNIIYICLLRLYNP